MWYILAILLIILIIYNSRPNPKCDKKVIIRKLVRQTARWATAASQDQNPMIAILHANYAVGYWSAIKEFATPEEIESSAGVDYFKVEEKIYEIQDKATRKMAAVCPKFPPPPTILTKIAGEGL